MPFQFNGTDITALVYNGVAIDQLIWNGVEVWKSGPLTGLFYGTIGSDGDKVARINASGVLVGSETTAGTARYDLAGAAVGANGLFYGGYSSGNRSSLVTRINASGAHVGSETTAGTARYNLAGAAVGDNGLFYGGNADPAATGSYYSSLVTRINASGAHVGSETNVGTARLGVAGAAVGGNGLFYGGTAAATLAEDRAKDTATRINASGVRVGSETNVGTARYDLAGATVGANGLFYGGYNYDGYNYIYHSRVTRINASGVLVGSETTAGTARYDLAGAAVGANGLFYGGYSSGGGNSRVDLVTRIDESGAHVGSETTAGTARQGAAGASL